MIKKAIKTRNIVMLDCSVNLIQPYFLIYFALPVILEQRVDPFIAAITACGINSGAYIAEIFRAGIQAIDEGQMEAGRSLGMTWVQTMRYIIVPQAFKNILPPREIQNAMEKQMKAERERRESILQAEGEKASKVLIAEGEKQSVLLQADAAKQAKIMAAEAEAMSILKVQQALADSMRMLNENAPNDQVIKLKALEALEKVADGKATKIIIPSEIQGIAGLAEGVVESVKNVPADERTFR